MNFTELLNEGNMDQIKKLAGDIMDKRLAAVLETKINNAKSDLGRRLASNAIRQNRHTSK